MLLLGVLIATGVSYMLGSTAFLEEREMRSVFAASSMRMILAIGLTVFACFHVRSAFDSREIDVMLSRPISRPALVLAYWLGFAAVASILVFLSVMFLLALGLPNVGGFFWFSVSLWLEALLVVALSLFAALAMKSAVASVISTLGFYVICRMMAFFVMTGDAYKGTDWWMVLSVHILKYVSALVPRFDFFADTEWLVYGIPGSDAALYFLLQFAIFLPLLLAASVLDFRRKQF